MTAQRSSWTDGPGFFPFFPPFLPDPPPPAIGGPDPPRGPIRHHLTDITGLVGEEPMPELGIVPVGVEERVRAIRLHHLARHDGVGPPPVVGLTRELEYPTRHRHRNPCSGELTHE